MKTTKNFLKRAAIALLTSQQLFAQTPIPALVTQTSGAGNESVALVATDPQGNVFHSGSYDGPMSIEGTVLQPIGSSFSKFYLSRFSPTGGSNWALPVGTDGFLINIQSIATDPDGSVLFTSNVFGDTVFLGTDTITFASTGFSKAFVAKVDSLGELVWMKEIRDTANSGIASNFKVITDNLGNFYTVGYHIGNINFDTIQISPVGPSDGQFIAKGDANGNFIWAKSFGSKDSDGQQVELAINAQNELFVSGSWEGDTLMVDGLILVNPNAGGFNSDRYIAKFNASGMATWLVREASTDEDNPSVLAPIANGGVACLSATEDLTNVVINEGGITVPGPNLLLTRYDALGDFKSYDTYVYTLGIWGGSWALSGDGTDLYMGFMFNTPTHVIGGTTLQNAGGSLGTEDLGVAKLDSLGNVIWAISLGGVEGELLGRSAYSAMGGFLFGASTSSPQLILGNDTISNSGTLSQEGFITALYSGIGVQENKMAASINVYPNPAKDVLHLDFDDVNAQAARVTIISSNGQVVKRTNVETAATANLNISDLAPGIYLLEIGVGRNYAVKKFVKH